MLGGGLLEKRQRAFPGWCSATPAGACCAGVLRSPGQWTCTRASFGDGAALGALPPSGPFAFAVFAPLPGAAAGWRADDGLDLQMGVRKGQTLPFPFSLFAVAPAL